MWKEEVWEVIRSDGWSIVRSVGFHVFEFEHPVHCLKIDE